MNQDKEEPSEVIFSDEDIKKIADYFSVLIEIEQDLKKKRDID